MDIFRLEAKVNSGAAWLDKVIPDWFERIDVNRLSITTTNRCILAQLPQADKKFGDRCLYSFGFAGSSIMDDDKLDELWKQKIREKLWTFHGRKFFTR